RVGEPGGLERGIARDAEDRTRRCRRRREEVPERRVHTPGQAPVVREEAAAGRARRQGDAHATGEETQPRMVLGQRVGLELVEDLQAVLDGAQVDEAITEKAAERGREIAALGEAEDGAQRVLLAEPRIVPPVEELERLHEELDLADAADAELDVAALGVLAAERAVDGAF